MGLRLRLRYGVLIVLVVIVGGALAHPGQAQGPPTNESCTELVQQAVLELASNCAAARRNTACYGFPQVEATSADQLDSSSFGTPGDTVDLANLAAIRTSPLEVEAEEWGLALMKVQANVPGGLPDQNATYLMVGEVEVVNVVALDVALSTPDLVRVTVSDQNQVRSVPGDDALAVGLVLSGTVLQADGISPDGDWLRVLYDDRAAWVAAEHVNSREELDSLPVITRGSRTPMQSFMLHTGWNPVNCQEELPDMLVVQSPRNTPITVTVNGVDLHIDSVVYLRTLPGEILEIIAVEGEITVYPGSSRQITLPAGTAVNVPLKDVGSWGNWRLLTRDEWLAFATIEAIPRDIWTYPFENPTIIQGSGIGDVVPIIETDDGLSTPVPPTFASFPRIRFVTGVEGEALERPAWEPLTIGAEVCPDWILYHSDRDGDWDIYRLGSSSPDDVSDNISQGLGSADIQPSYSRDSQWAAFASNRETAGDWELFLGRTDGSRQVRVTYNTATDINPVWGSGSVVVFESNRDANWELYSVDLAGDGLPHRLTEDPADDINPFWLPDGEHIVFQSNRDGDWEIYMLNVADGTLTQLTDNAVADINPVISHDGSLMAWLQMSDYGVLDLWLINLESGGVRQLTDIGVDVSAQVFAPDDTFLAYHANVDGDYDVFVVDVATGRLKALTVNDDVDRAPTFRCNTSTVVYYSDVPSTPDEPRRYRLLEVNPLPFSEPVPLATVLTNDLMAHSMFPVGDPREEMSSCEEAMPQRIWGQ
ncbi:MAG: hypothetical protein GYB65_05160 [Chloroflexi bacterium]|nr:hypothetical protein [Chloroflexota bacterium]